MPGTYRDTRWRHCEDHEIKDQWFAQKIDEFVKRLTAHRSFLDALRSSGGSACLIVSFLDAEYFSDEMPVNTLSIMADLKLDLGIQIYGDTQV